MLGAPAPAPASISPAAGGLISGAMLSYRPPNTRPPFECPSFSGRWLVESDICLKDSGVVFFTGLLLDYRCREYNERRQKTKKKAERP